MICVFEFGALDKKPVTFVDKWFQITYDELRDSDDNMIAYRNAENYWVLNNGEGYSDIIFGD